MIKGQSERTITFQWINERILSCVLVQYQAMTMGDFTLTDSFDFPGCFRRPEFISVPKFNHDLTSWPPSLIQNTGGNVCCCLRKKLVGDSCFHQTSLHLQRSNTLSDILFIGIGYCGLVMFSKNSYLPYITFLMCFFLFLLYYTLHHKTENAECYIL